MIRGGALATVVALVVLVAGLALKQDTGAAAGGPAVKAGKASKVTIADFKFGPPSIEVKAGSKITFTNEDTAPHTATSKTAGAFDTGALRKGQSKTVTLSKKGDFKYYCEFHAFMTGDVKVD